jgi:hypothetical protein
MLTRKVTQKLNRADFQRGFETLGLRFKSTHRRIGERNHCARVGKLISANTKNGDRISASATQVYSRVTIQVPAEVIPIATQHYLLLQERPAYTGVTTGKRQTVLVGQPCT